MCRCKNERWNHGKWQGKYTTGKAVGVTGKEEAMIDARVRSSSLDRCWTDLSRFVDRHRRLAHFNMTIFVAAVVTGAVGHLSRPLSAHTPRRQKSRLKGTNHF